MKYLLPVLAVICGVVWANELHAQPPLDGPLRAVHLGGNWGTNREVVDAWTAEPSGPLIPPDYLAWLRSLRVNWVGISVALHYDDSMDSTVERVYSAERQIPTFSDETLRQLIGELRADGIDVYLTLSFESHEAEGAERPLDRGQLGRPAVPDYGPAILPEHWPWLPSHPDHTRFVAEFWRTYTDQAVHYARIAQAEGVRLYSLGTETDSLVRTRSGGDYWVNDFHDELQAMVASVRAEYDGLLTYDMHPVAVESSDFFVGSKHLWEDLDLDVVGLSAGFALTETPPAAVMSVERLEQGFDDVFTEHLLPLAADNPGRPIVFTEYYALDTVETPADPANFRRQGEIFVFSDSNGNGVDDGRETQANVFRALFRTMDRHPGVVNGTFFWDNWMASQEHWERHWAHRRSFSIRDKPAEEVVGMRYDQLRQAEPTRVRAVGRLPDQTLYAGTVAVAVVVPVAPAFRNASTYEASSSAPGVATVNVSGSTVTVTSVAEGAATITVTATGPNRSSARHQFDVAVRASTPPRPSQFLKLRRRIEALRARERGR